MKSSFVKQSLASAPLSLALSSQHFVFSSSSGSGFRGRFWETEEAKVGFSSTVPL